MRLANVPSVDLVHESLVDQVEVNQILAHRDAQPLPPSPPPSPDRLLRGARVARGGAWDDGATEGAAWRCVSEWSGAASWPA